MLRGVWTLLSMTGIPRLIFRLMMDRRVPFGLKLLLPAAFVYIIVPWDFDFIPIFGRLDDLVVLIAAGLAFLLLAPRDVVMEASGSPRKAESDHSPDKDTTVIEGEYRKLDE